jgi:hypothetical protein
LRRLSTVAVAGWSAVTSTIKARHLSGASCAYSQSLAIKAISTALGFNAESVEYALNELTNDWEAMPKNVGIVEFCRLVKVGDDFYSALAAGDKSKALHIASSSGRMVSNA